jgi:2',3'-cyclic-nucleotide 2'-phosphodiesterase (5'-nucleotidase family)
VVIDRLRQAGPILVLDAGNALFKDPVAAADSPVRTKAEFLLRTMGQLGTVAMPAGLRDLSAGLQFLKDTAARAGVRVLSVNLLSSGKSVFPKTLVTRVGDVRVGLIGVSPVGKFASAPGVEGGPIIQPTLAEARKLRKTVDLVVVLAAVPFADALELAKEAQDSVDLILHSHESRGAGIAQRQDRNFLIPTGERGRQLGELTLDLSGKGPFADLSEIERSRQVVQLLERQIAETQKRLSATSDPATQRALQEALTKFKERKKTMENEPLQVKGRRTLSLSFADLGPEVADDPALKEQVARFEVQGSGK